MCFLEFSHEPPGKYYKTDSEFPLIQIVFENDDFLVINKPAGLVCHPTKSGLLSSVVGQLRLLKGEKFIPRLIHRIDRETSGIILVAKNASAARIFGSLIESGAVIKQYLAIVHGWINAKEFVINLPIGPDLQSPVAIKDCIRPDGRKAFTRFKLLKQFERMEGRFSLISIILGTGRKHQIRVHLSAIGHPVVGDKIYGVDERFYLAFINRELTPEMKSKLILPWHALHCQRLEFPWHGEHKKFVISPEAWFKKFLIECNNMRQNKIQFKKI